MITPIKNPRSTYNRNNRYTFDYLDNNRGNDITVTGAERVAEYYFYAATRYIRDLYPDLYCFASDVRDEVTDYTVTKAGKIAKRVSTYLYKKHRIRITAEQLSQLGNIANSYKIRGFDYEYKFVKEFDWEDGMFGHSGSCWFTDEHGYENSRDILDTAAGYAMLFYRVGDDYDPYNGVGRVWILPVLGDNEGLFLFNAYGVELSDAAQLICDAMPGYTWKKIYCYNGTSDIYINNNRGAVIYRNENQDIRESECISLHLESTHREGYYHDLIMDESDNYFRCERCGDRHHVDDMYSTDYSTYCEDCYNELYGYCVRCNTDSDRDSGTVYDGEFYCEDCANELFVTCDDCATILHKDDDNYYILDDGDTIYCERCYNRNNCNECESCNEHFHGDDILNCDGSIYCKDCADKLGYYVDSMGYVTSDNPRPVVTDNQLPLFNLDSVAILS